MSKESDLDAIAASVRDFIDQETPTHPQWQVNVGKLRDAISAIGTFFTDTDQTAADLESRVDEEHDAQGKHSPPSQWLRDAGAPIFVDASRFQFIGDRRADFAVGHRIRAELTLGSFVIAAIKTIAHDIGTNRTTITLDAPGLTSALSGIDRGLVRQSIPKIQQTDLMPFLGTALRGVTLEVVEGSPTQCTVTYLGATIQGMPLQPIAIVPLPLSTAGGTGAGRLDTGNWVANTPYAVYLCTNDAGTAATITASLSPVAPILPTAYTRALFLGYVLTDAIATNFVPFRQEAMRVTRRSSTALSVLNVSGAGDFRSPSLRTVDLSAHVPPGVRAAWIEVFFSTGSISPAGLRQLFAQPFGATALGETVTILNASNAIAQVGPRRQPLDASRRFQLTVVPPGGDNSLYSLVVSAIGWDEHRAAA